MSFLELDELKLMEYSLHTSFKMEVSKTSLGFWTWHCVTFTTLPDQDQERSLRLCLVSVSVSPPRKFVPAATFLREEGTEPGQK